MESQTTENAERFWFVESHFVSKDFESITITTKKWMNNTSAANYACGEIKIIHQFGRHGGLNILTTYFDIL